eukprot:TRINITY_DN75851_c0_g1_i1.p2 TRINITY_DN75851_c0_g1~~TRINITY_DN75851_c0_g1_i1.p2  ORF type:complete len:202 (+),score=27.57 TRINITY_DN75851_c0_g1_i1:178-783(+)
MERALVRDALAELMADRIEVPFGHLGSMTDNSLLNLPAGLFPDERVQLGDLGHVSDLLEGGGSESFRKHLEQHPITAVLVCMGTDAAEIVSKEFNKLGLAYMGLDGCVDEEGYPLIETHLKTAVEFIREQLIASAPNGCVLIHCHEGKNRSAALCVGYLMKEYRMKVIEAVEHVWLRRPIVLTNQSFVDQLMDLAESEGLL